MIVTLIAIVVAFLLGIYTTTRFYENKISKIEARHERALEKEFHVSYGAGWNDGAEHGKRMERLDQITARIQAKS